MFFTQPHMYGPLYLAYPSLGLPAYNGYDYYDCVNDPRLPNRTRAARAAESERAAAANELASQQLHRRVQREAEEDGLLRELQAWPSRGAPKRAGVAALAKTDAARAKKLKKMRVARNKAALRIAAAYRGHRVRHHDKPLEQRRAAAALSALEKETNRVFADIVAPAKAAPTAERTHIASEHLMRQLLKLDELTQMAGAEAVRSRRKALSTLLNQAIDELDRMSEALSSSQHDSTDDELSDSAPSNTVDEGATGKDAFNTTGSAADDSTEDVSSSASSASGDNSDNEEADVEMVDAPEHLSHPTPAEADSIAMSHAPAFQSSATGSRDQLDIQQLHSTIRELEKQNAHLRKLLAAQQLSTRRGTVQISL
mmetsp:Transcript_19656/g.50792  ORF Transcript_19656/g.50792 Transcript_19656/m.50792 type:complete len:369 (-) Transcript_19656:73-1179(-)